MRLRLTLLPLLLIAGCTPTEPVEEATSREADVEAIDQLRQEYSIAYNAGDAAALAGLYTDDAVLLPPNDATLTGKEAIQSMYEVTFDQFTGEHSTTSQEIEVAGDWAFGQGTFRLKLAPKDGSEPVEEEGKYIVICQRQPDGSWKIARLIWNNDPPLGTVS